MARISASEAKAVIETIHGVRAVGLHTLNGKRELNIGFTRADGSKASVASEIFSDGSVSVESVRHALRRYVGPNAETAFAVAALRQTANVA